MAIYCVFLYSRCENLSRRILEAVSFAIIYRRFFKRNDKIKCEKEKRRILSPISTQKSTNANIFKRKESKNDGINLGYVRLRWICNKLRRTRSFIKADKMALFLTYNSMLNVLCGIRFCFCAETLVLSRSFFLTRN